MWLLQMRLRCARKSTFAAFGDPVIGTRRANASHVSQSRRLHHPQSMPRYAESGCERSATVAIFMREKCIISSGTVNRWICCLMLMSISHDRLEARFGSMRRS